MDANARVRFDPKWVIPLILVFLVWTLNLGPLGLPEDTIDKGRVCLKFGESLFSRSALPYLAIGISILQTGLMMAIFVMPWRYWPLAIPVFIAPLFWHRLIIWC
jgi:hypothetical protein